MSLKSLLERMNERVQDPFVEIGNLLLEQEETRPPEKLRAMIQHLIPRDALFATFLLKCRFIKNHPDVQTAGVNIQDGKINFYYNEAFIDTFPPEQLMFIIAHEFYHIARLHLDRAARRKLSNDLYNVAGDMIINENILGELKSVAGLLLKMPTGKYAGLRIDKGYAKKVKDPKLWTTEGLYKHLEKEQKKRQQGQPKPPSKKDLMVPGRVVRIGDDEKYGAIEKVNKDGTYEIKPISKTEAKKRVKPA